MSSEVSLEENRQLASNPGTPRRKISLISSRQAGKGILLHLGERYFIRLARTFTKYLIDDHKWSRPGRNSSVLFPGSVSTLV